MDKTRQHKALPNDTPDKTKASLTEPELKRKTKKGKIKANAIPLIYCFHSPRRERKGEHNHQSKTELKQRTRERVKNGPSCLHFGSDIWQLPFKSESLLGPVGDGSPIPCLVIKSGF